METPSLKSDPAPGTTDATSAQAPRQNPFVKLLIELGPLLVFFAVYGRAGIYWATGVLMIATIIALAAAWKLQGRLSPVPLATAVLVVVFGGLTFLLDDPSFIKMKPTFINLLFAGVLVAGMVAGRPLLKLVLGEAFNLTEEGWHKLTMRWVFFFVAVAGLNEVIWRNFSEATWVNFKVFGVLPLTVVFAMAQVGLIRRHEVKQKA